VDLGLPPTPGIPQEPSKAREVLEAVGVILECLWEAHASDTEP
jgi:hypothetical protein